MKFYLFFCFSANKDYELTIWGICHQDIIEDIVNQLTNEDIFPQLEFARAVSRENWEEIKNKMNQRYKPSDDHRKNCINDYCYQRSNIELTNSLSLSWIHNMDTITSDLFKFTKE